MESKLNLNFQNILVILRVRYRVVKQMVLILKNKE